MANEITLTIDGQEVRTTPGTNVLQAAMDAGIYVPYLCYYPGMKAFGACRMCIVEIEGGPPGNQASCTVPAADGMVVNTKTDGVTDSRRGIMDLLLSEHPHGCLTCHRIDLCGPNDICLRHVSVNDRCVTCPKNERCELKDTVRFLEMDMDTPLTYNNRQIPLRVADPMWDMDLNLCIVCGRCVRVCDEVRGGQRTDLHRQGRAGPDRDLERHVAARVGMRVLRRMHRRVPHGRPRGAQVQVEQGRKDGHLCLPHVPRRLPDDPGGRRAGQAHQGHPGPVR